VSLPCGNGSVGRGKLVVRVDPLCVHLMGTRHAPNKRDYAHQALAFWPPSIPSF
jgi:hypothetical protein